MTALLMAVDSIKIDSAQLLLPISDPLATMNDATTAFMLAAYDGSSDLVQLLLPLTDPLAMNSHGETALMRAAKGGHSKPSICSWTLAIARP